MIDSKTRPIILTLLGIGIIPALIILMFMDLVDGQLQVADQAIAEYNLAMLLAAVSSLARPILLLTPLALALTKTTMRPFLILGLLYPTLILAPSLVSGLMVGGSFSIVWLRALALWCALGLCLNLWIALLNRFLGERQSIVLYAMIWAVSTYSDHLRLYVLPYLDIAALKLVNVFNWVLPQIGSGPSAIDDLLQVGEIEASALLPTAIQLPLLLLGFVYISRKDKSQPTERT